MPPGWWALALRATLLAVSTRVTSALLVGSQSEQTHIGKDSSLLDLGLSGNSEEIDELLDCQHIANKSAQSYILLGPMDSGTNLLHQLMYAAWPSQACMQSCGIVWKHTLTGADDIYRFLLTRMDREALRKTVVLHTVRSPISQLASWRRKPYELLNCVWRMVADWGQPCTANMGPNHHAGGTKPTVYNSTMELYHQYLRQIEELREAGWFKAVISVSYEDMLFSPTETITEIAKHFDGLKKVQKADMEAAVKEPATPRSSAVDDELARMENKAYFLEFHLSDVKTICKGLNRTLVEQYQAGTFLEPNRRVSYWEDCAHV